MKTLINLSIAGAVVGVAYYIYKNNKDHKALIASAHQKIVDAEAKINDMGAKIKSLTKKIINTTEVS